jgi:hypothetical protein
MKIKIISLLIITLAVNCSSAPKIKPVSDKASDVVIPNILAKIKFKNYFNGDEIDDLIGGSQVFLMKVDPKKKDLLPPAKELIQSNYVRGGFHFLNISPGKYRIVAFTHSYHTPNTQGLLDNSVTRSYAFYLSNDAMKKTEFEVAEKQFKITGTVHLKSGKTASDGSMFNATNPEFKDSPYGNQLGPDMSGYSKVNYFHHSIVEIEKIELTDETLKEVKNTAKESFADTEWMYLLK